MVFIQIWRFVLETCLLADWSLLKCWFWDSRWNFSPIHGSEIKNISFILVPYAVIFLPTFMSLPFKIRQVAVYHTFALPTFFIHENDKNVLESSWEMFSKQFLIATGIVFRTCMTDSVLYWFKMPLEEHVPVNKNLAYFLRKN